MLTIGGIVSGGGGNSSFYYSQQKKKKKENKDKLDQKTKNTDNFDEMLNIEMSKFKIDVLV